MRKALLLKTCMTLATLAVIAAITGSATAYACDKGPGASEPCPIPEKQGDGRHHQWMEKLNLSADQKEKIDQIRNEHHEAIKASAEQLRAEHGKMRDMMQDDATDAQLREQHDKVRALRTLVGDAWFESFLKIRAILTPGQRKRMSMMHHAEMSPDGTRHGEPGIKTREKK